MTVRNPAPVFTLECPRGLKSLGKKFKAGVVRATGSLDRSPKLREIARQRKRRQSGRISQAISAKQRKKTRFSASK